MKKILIYLATLAAVIFFAAPHADAQSNKLTLPEITVPEGKTFLGWFIQTVSETGSTTMELAFEPNESNTVALPAQTVLEPMTLYALFQ